MISKTFCSSPWFHVKIGLNGDYHVCRWAQETATGQNIATTTIMEFYNSSVMKQLRQDFLAGQQPPQCQVCYYQDQFGKVSGRLRQLNKSAIRVDHFAESLLSSPHRSLFEHSLDNQGVSSHFPTDLQVDLGNTCNSACVMCDPRSSSRLQHEYKKLHELSSKVFAKYQDFSNWADNPELVENFCQQIGALPYVRYMHFLGGETLYNPAFYRICQQLPSAMIVGTTTNGTIYSDQLENLISRFDQFHLGISIESVTDLNDYIRYPSQIGTVLENIHKFLALRQRHPGLHLELRITPNLFTIYELDQVFDFMIEHNIIAESCNILYKPECLRMELLPEDIRQETIQKLERVCKQLGPYQNQVNTRRSDLSRSVIAQTANEYVNFLRGYQRPDNYLELQKQLVEFLHTFESLRQNRITDHAPRYREFLHSIGY
jgi:MoaA/NifB/PqqE/SkfB family radical SAM enzyme